MINKILVVSILVLVIVLGALIMRFRMTRGPENTPSLSGVASATTIPVPTKAKNSIEIEVGKKITPVTLTVNANEEVHWYSKEFATYTIRESKGLFSSPPMMRESLFSYTFKQKGTYTYELVPLDVQGTIIVN